MALADEEKRFALTWGSTARIMVHVASSLHMKGQKQDWVRIIVSSPSLPSLLLPLPTLR
jgi:hypothetical protein